MQTLSGSLWVCLACLTSSKARLWGFGRWLRYVHGQACGDSTVSCAQLAASRG